MVRYISPVNPAVYPHLAVTLLSIGLFFMAWFFVYPPPLDISIVTLLVSPSSLYCTCDLPMMEGRPAIFAN